MRIKWKVEVEVVVESDKMEFLMTWLNYESSIVRGAKIDAVSGLADILRLLSSGRYFSGVKMTSRWVISSPWTSFRLGFVKDNLNLPNMSVESSKLCQNTYCHVVGRHLPKSQLLSSRNSSPDRWTLSQ